MRRRSHQKGDHLHRLIMYKKEAFYDFGRVALRNMPRKNYLGNALRRILIFFRVINAIATSGRLIPKIMTSTSIMNEFRASLIK